jgi:hypothetical protein
MSFDTYIHLLEASIIVVIAFVVVAVVRSSKRGSGS